MVFVNPGVKLGYQFGQNGGFVYGFEVSLTALHVGFPIVGFVWNVDFCRDNTKVHFGAELSAGIIGINIGPSFYTTKNGSYTGLTIGLYTGLLLIPYYETSRFYGDTSSFSVNQFGGYLKAPIPMGGDGGNFGFDAH